MYDPERACFTASNNPPHDQYSTGCTYRRIPCIHAQSVALMPDMTSSNPGRGTTEMTDTMFCKLGKIELLSDKIHTLDHMRTKKLSSTQTPALTHIEHVHTHDSMPQILTTSNPASYHISFPPSPSRIDLHHKQSTDP